MTTLGAVLKSIVPQADPVSDFRVEDHLDGKGPQLVHWNEAKLGPRPTQAQIDAATVAFVPRVKNSIEAKLARVGLTLGELKAALNKP